MIHLERAHNMGKKPGTITKEVIEKLKSKAEQYTGEGAEHQAPGRMEGKPEPSRASKWGLAPTPEKISTLEKN